MTPTYSIVEINWLTTKKHKKFKFFSLFQGKHSNIQF